MVSTDDSPAQAGPGKLIMGAIPADVYHRVNTSVDSVVNARHVPCLDLGIPEGRRRQQYDESVSTKLQKGASCILLRLSAGMSMHTQKQRGTGMGTTNKQRALVSPLVSISFASTTEARPLLDLGVNDQVAGLKDLPFASRCSVTVDGLAVPRPQMNKVHYSRMNPTLVLQACISRQSHLRYHSMPIAHCPLPIAHCPLPIAHCPLPTAHCPF